MAPACRCAQPSRRRRRVLFHANQHLLLPRNAHSLTIAQATPEQQVLVNDCYSLRRPTHRTWRQPKGNTTRMPSRAEPSRLAKSARILESPSDEPGTRDCSVALALPVLSLLLQPRHCASLKIILMKEETDNGSSSHQSTLLWLRCQVYCASKHFRLLETKNFHVLARLFLFILLVNFILRRCFREENFGCLRQNCYGCGRDKEY